MNEFIRTYLHTAGVQGRENPPAKRQYQIQKRKDMTLYLCSKCKRVWETYAISGFFYLEYFDSGIFNRVNKQTCPLCLDKKLRQVDNDHYISRRRIL